MRLGNGGGHGDFQRQGGSQPVGKCQPGPPASPSAPWALEVRAGGVSLPESPVAPENRAPGNRTGESAAQPLRDLIPCSGMGMDPRLQWIKCQLEYFIALNALSGVIPYVWELF